MKKIVYILVLLHAVAALAQKQTNIWYFGGNAGLDFNSGTPVPLNDGQVNTSEGSSSIADENGNLLFYTEGVTVYNKNHQVMQNGEGLLGHQSCSQSAFIVGKPGSDTLYYIFTVGAVENPVGLHYSEVDMAANGGLGAVTANKNINLLDNTTEGIAATLHSNGTDIWVLVHRFPGNAWYSYLVTANGVNPEPVISTAGPVYEVYTEWASPNDEIGYLKISPQGTRAAIASHGKGITVFDYDKSTGAVSNAVQLSQGGFWSGPYGVEFSPSGKLLYGSRMGVLTQYNLEAADVAASGVVLRDDPFFAWGAMQLASNGKLYKSEGFQDYISVIHNPDVIGAGCNLQPYGLYLGGWGYSNLGLPNAMASFFVKPDFEAQSLCLGSPSQFTFLWNRVPGSVLWEFGDGTTSAQQNPAHTYAASGTYTVKLTVTLSAATWVTERQVTVAESPQFTLGGPYEACVASSVTLSAQAQNFDPAQATYLWELNGQPVGNAATLQPQEFGNYSLTVTVNGCAATQNVEVTGINIAATFSEGCDGNSYTLAAAPVNGSFDAATATYTWEGPDGFSANGQQVVITDGGNYALTVTTAGGCTINHTWEVLDAGCEEPKIPKGVSPNGDGLNDVFDLTLHDVARLDIFNRYGLQVFSQEHYTTQWHGQTAGGHELPDGTYYYRILKHNGLNLTGWVYVNRESR